MMTVTTEMFGSRVVSDDGTERCVPTSGQGPPPRLAHGGVGDHTRWDAPRPHASDVVAPGLGPREPSTFVTASGGARP